MFGLFKNRTRERIVERVYAEIVAQARQPVFYTHHRVPDTIEARYELMVLHVFLLLDRFRDADERASDAAQAVCDHFFLEMDRAMREMGVGDLSVPKKMKKIAGVYTARAAAYAQALAADDPQVLPAVIARHVLGDGAEEGDAAPLASYMRASVAHLRGHDPIALIEKGVSFPDPGAFIGGEP